MNDAYHCPECGYEWSGHGRAPPYPFCPKCNDGVMRAGESPAESRPVGEIVAHLSEQAEKCVDESRGPIHGSDYARGVCSGLRYAADELEDIDQ